MQGEKMMITGASGFLGTVLIERAVEAGCEVIAAYLHNEVEEGEGISPLRLDLTDEPSVRDAVARLEPELVVHAAYRSGQPRVNVDAAGYLARACASLDNPPHFLFTSTDLVFDGGVGWYTEQHDPRPQLAYGKQKLAAERAVRDALPSACIIRTSLIYDLKRLPGHLDFAVKAIEAGEEFLFFVDEFRSPVHVDDLCEAILALCGRRLPGLWHTAGAHRIDRWSFGTRLLRALGYSAALARPGTLHDTDSIRPPDCSLDSSKARGELGVALRGVNEVLVKGKAGEML